MDLSVLLPYIFGFMGAQTSLLFGIFMRLGGLTSKVEFLEKERLKHA